MVTIITSLPPRRYSIEDTLFFVNNNDNDNYVWTDYLLRLFLLGGSKQRAVICNHSADSLTTTCYIDPLFEAALIYLTYIKLVFTLRHRHKWINDKEKLQIK